MGPCFRKLWMLFSMALELVLQGHQSTLAESSSKLFRKRHFTQSDQKNWARQRRKRRLMMQYTKNFQKHPPMPNHTQAKWTWGRSTRACILSYRNNTNHGNHPSAKVKIMTNDIRWVGLYRFSVVDVSASFSCKDEWSRKTGTKLDSGRSNERKSQKAHSKRTELKTNRFTLSRTSHWLIGCKNPAALCIFASDGSIVVCRIVCIPAFGMGKLVQLTARMDHLQI